MMPKPGPPKTLLWVLNLLAIYLCLFTALRLAMLIAFAPPAGEALSGLWPALWLGLRYDLRWISGVLLPLVVVGLHPTCSPFFSARSKRLWTAYLVAVTLVMIFFFAADFGCFSYNKTRLNASALNFAEDALISALMLWESYPVLWLLAALGAVVWALGWLFSKSHFYVVSKARTRPATGRHRWLLAAALGLGLLVHGSLTARPLQWDRAFGLQDSYRAYLALNPLQNFFTTLRFRKPQANDSLARASYPLMKSWLQLPAADFSYQRFVAPGPQALPSRPNVVLVLCESFSMYKSSLSGNPLNTTPYFDSLARGGIFFERCFTPHFSTARGLFATLTGIPDVQLSKFSTRNPQALDQHTIVNNFAGYRKLYFLGGNPGFNNFSGLLQNIHGLEMVTEGSFRAQPVNVWGISDKDLFLEANEHFARQQEPFFAILQTADNHRPFAIPQGEKEFRSIEVSPDSLEKYGFESLEEFNAFRYSDYCFRVFMEAARREAYFQNTVFVFVGDHGVSGNARATYGDVWTDERLTDQHVPLLFYAPALLAPRRRSEVVSQIDVLPTVASLTGQHYVNTTLGRDLLRPAAAHPGAFIIHHDAGRIGMVSQEYYFVQNLNFPRHELHFLAPHTYTTAQQDSIKAHMAQLTTAYYETARWMLLNNKQRYVPQPPAPLNP